MPRMRSGPAVVMALLLLPAMMLATVPAMGQLEPELVFEGVHDYAVDTNNNTQFDQLVIEIVVDVSEEDTYTFVVELTYERNGRTLLVGERPPFRDVALAEGENTVEMVFPSEDIFETGHVGPFTVDIEVQKWDGGFTPWELTATTGFYDHRSFDAEDNPPPVPPDAPKVEFLVDYVNIRTSMFQVYVNRTSPEVVYSYRDERPDLPEFVISYSRLVFFEDDGDGVYDGDDETASVVLTNYKWSFTNVDVSGPRVAFDLRTRLPVAVGGEFVSANVSLTFTITNGTAVGPGSSYFIQGGASEVKMDVSVELDEVVPSANYVALEAVVGDTLGNHDFLMEEPSGFVRYARTNETSYLPVPRLPVSKVTTIGLVDSNGVQHAFVGWVNTASERWASSGPADVEVVGSFRVCSGSLELVLSYPYSADMVGLEHDPSAGVLEDNLPPEPPAPEPDDGEPPNIYLYLFAAIAGAVILVLSVYARAQGY